MLKHYIKFAIRNFRSNKVIFVGSLATLCLGALCISLLYTYIENELSMNDFSKKEIVETDQTSNSTENQHKRQNDIYLMLMRDSPKSQWQVTCPSTYWKFDYTKYPELENTVRVSRYKKGEFKFKYNSNKFYPTGLIVDSTFFKVFDYKLKAGNRKTALKTSNTVIISEKLASKIFGSENPIGKDIKIEEVEKGKFDRFFKVTGVVTIPSNSSMEFDFLIPKPTNVKDRNKFNRMGGEFILTKKGFNKDAFIKKMILDKESYFDNAINKSNSKFKNYLAAQKNHGLSLVSLNDVYFNREININYIGIFSKFGDERNNNIIIIIMLVIVIISVLNFSNLQIVNINTILKQIGISKINGAKKRHLFYQKITEITVILVLALLCSTLLYQLVLPRFNLFFNIELAPSVFKILITNTLILSLIAILSLIYPVITIYKLSPIAGLKNKVSTSKQLIGKKVITIIQYALSFILLIVSVIVVKQLDLMLSKDLGIKSSNIIYTKLFYNPPIPQNFRNLKKEEQEELKKAYLNSHQYLNNELISSPAIASASQGTSLLKPYKSTYKADNGSEDFTSQNYLNVTSEHLKVYNFEMLEGRFFNLKTNNPEFLYNNNAVIINEAAKKFWNIDDITTTSILGKRVKPAKIIGVVKDFNYEHLSAKPQPLIIKLSSKLDADFHIRFQENRVHEGLQFIEELFIKINPNETFSYTFLSDEIADLYQKEKRLSTIYILFTIIALLISAIGLFTIALYDTQQRTKEIGIRKVNGATINEIMLMLNKDFIKWVIIAFVIACPIAYYAMSKWLESFAYKTTLSWWVFALAGVFTLVIALLTVSWQSYRAATRNPVEALRDE